MHYDFIIIGAGIAGACTAYALKQQGFTLLVLEKNSICSGGSAAAGAFLSPKMSKPSPYKTYLNDALEYSLDFYTKHFPNLLYKNGLLKLPLDHSDALRCKTYEPFMTMKWEKTDEEYFFPNAGIISAQQLTYALLKDIDVQEHHKVQNITCHDHYWEVDNYKTTAVILATGDTPLPFSIPYLRTKNIGGYRYDIQYDGDKKQSYNIHKTCSISTYFENKVAIGATHIKEDINLEEAAQKDSYHLVKQVQDILPLPNIKRIKSYVGYRNFTSDYFPIVGSVVDDKNTLEAFPYIKTGTKVSIEKFYYYPNLYIHTALGSRGFVYAPYNAKLLVDLIVHKQSINPNLSTSKRFIKWARQR